MKKILWVIFLLLAAYMYYQGYIVKNAPPVHYALIKAQSADSTLGRQMFRVWRRANYGNGTILDIAVSNTHIDFFFIASYTLLLMFCSYAQMQNEATLWLNSLLRLNVLLALFAACMDITENNLILYNIRHLDDKDLYISPYWPSSIKWALAGFAVLVWFISLINSGIRNYRFRHAS